MERWRWTLIALIMLLLREGYALPNIIRIGGLFDASSEEQELTFRIAVDWINSDKSFLSRSRLVALEEQLEQHDSFRATKKVCALLQSGIAGIFGPQSDITSMNVQSICDALEVPHVETRWDIQPQRDDLSINLYPKPSVISQAFVELVTIWGWKEFYLVYEDYEGLIRLQGFLKEAQRKGWKIQLHQFQPGQPYRDLFWHIKKSHGMALLKDKGRSDQAIRIVLDVKRENLYTVLKQAQQVGMVTENQYYLVTSLDLHTIDMEDFKYGKTNLTGLRIVDEDNPEYQSLLAEVNSRLTRPGRNDTALRALQTETALMYDAVKLFAHTLQDLDTSKSINFSPISCENHEKGVDGTSIINYMRPNKLHGVTGLVRFDGQGFRSEFSLDLMYLTSNGLEKIGTFIPGGSINITRNLSPDYDDLAHMNKKYIVSTVLNDPYAMLKESAGKLTGNDRFEGYCIELIEALSEILHFTFEIRLVKDSKYGIKDEKGVWNGMIGEVLRGEADMALVDLTITSAREEAVEFSMPFMNTGISILFKKPTTKVTSLFSFLSPFSMEVWLYVMAVYIGVSVVLFIVGRLSPYEWDNPHPCRQEDQVLENSFSLLNSMWFTIGSLMQQGSDVAPCASSTRTIAGIWYFFTLIMISSYTANLAAFLTVEKVIYPIESAADLAKQTKIKYGCLESGSTRAFFKDSKFPIYKKMWDFMASTPGALMKSNDRGKSRVSEGDYAYFMESASIEYITERECNLTQIGGPLDSKSYGIATRRGSKLAAWLSKGILKLQEDGKLHDFKERWWKQKKGGGQCADAAKQSGGVTELGLGNVGGVFVVLMAGLALSAVVATLEFLWKSRKMGRKDTDEPICKEMLRELMFAVSCSSSVKPVNRRKSETENNSVATMPSFGSQN